MISQSVNEATGSANAIYEVLNNMQNTMKNLKTHIEQQQQIVQLIQQQSQLHISIPSTNFQQIQVNFSGIFRKLYNGKNQNTNFVARDRHDIDFLGRMLDDYESGCLPPRTKEAWEERVLLLNSVSDNGWPSTI